MITSTSWPSSSRLNLIPVARCSSSSTTSTLDTVGLDAPGKGDGERGPAVRSGALRGDRPPVPLDHRAHDEEPETGPGPAPPHLRADAVEAVEYEREVG